MNHALQTFKIFEKRGHSHFPHKNGGVGKISLMFILTNPLQCYLSLSVWCVCVCVFFFVYLHHFYLYCVSQEEWWWWIVFEVCLTDGRLGSLSEILTVSPAGITVRGSHHHQSLTCRKQDLNLCRTCFQALINGVVQ